MIRVESSTASIGGACQLLQVRISGGGTDEQEIAKLISGKPPWRMAGGRIALSGDLPEWVKEVLLPWLKASSFIEIMLPTKDGFQVVWSNQAARLFHTIPFVHTLPERR